MMKLKYKGLLRKIRDSHKYLAEMFTLEFVEDIVDLMKKQGVSQKDLAKRMKNSEAYISKVLNGYENLSINSISKIAFALNAAPHIHIAEKDVVVEWKERSSAETRTPVSFQASADVFARVMVSSDAVFTASGTIVSLGAENKFRRAGGLSSEYPDERELRIAQGFRLVANR